MLARVFEDAVPATVEEKKAFLAAHGIALWDVIASCRIEGSADSSIRDVTPRAPLSARASLPCGRSAIGNFRRD